MLFSDSSSRFADILKLVKRIRAECPDKDIWVWTGYKLDDLNAAQMQVVDLINVLVDGKFVQDLKDPSLIWRGSSNQVVHHLRLSLIQPFSRVFING